MGDYHLPTLFSRVFAPAEECQDPAYCNNRARCQQRRVAILRVERQQRRDDESTHKQCHGISARLFSDDHSGYDQPDREEKYSADAEPEVIVDMVAEQQLHRHLRLEHQSQTDRKRIADEVIQAETCSRQFISSNSPKTA